MAGGLLTTVDYSPLTLHAHLKPQRFAKKKVPLPRPALPRGKLMLKYLDPDRRGYLHGVQPGDVILDRTSSRRTSACPPKNAATRKSPPSPTRRIRSIARTASRRAAHPEAAVRRRSRPSSPINFLIT